MLTVKDLAKLSSVSTRTIRYYDAIDLLQPSVVGSNGYRYYGQAELLRLQQILLYKELELDLETIKELLAKHTTNLADLLVEHRSKLTARIKRLEVIIGTIDRTIEHLEGAIEMKDNEIFIGFSDEVQEKYAKEAETMYDPETVRESNRRWKSYSKDKRTAILNEGGEIMIKMADLMDLEPGDARVQALIGAWRANMENFWVPNLDHLVGLGELYNQDERFKANYEKVKPGLAAFYLAAIKEYVCREKTS